MTFLEGNGSVVNTLYAKGMLSITAVGRVVRVNGERIKLTDQETNFLFCVVAGNGTVRTKAMLFGKLYPHFRDVDVKIFDVLACKIRSKLQRVHKEAGKVLRTVWGRGYAWGTPNRDSVPITKISLPLDLRWTPARKAAIIDMLILDRVSVGEVLDYYVDLSAEELLELRQGYMIGYRGLHTTKISPKDYYRHAA